MALYTWLVGALAGFAMTDVISGIQGVLSDITSEFSIANIGSIIAIVLGAVVGLFLFWWGVRWVVRKISAAFTKGKMSV